MTKSQNSSKAKLFALLISCVALSLMIVPMSARLASLVTPQGKGGEVVAKPTPTPKKKTTKRNTPARTTNNSKTNQADKTASEAVAAAEMIFWNSIKDSTNPEDFRSYLKKYPDGQFADLANNRIRALEDAKATLTPVPTPNPVPEPVYEWAKSERDLPAPVRLEWSGDIKNEYKELSFSVPSGWTRTKREEKQKDGDAYMQVSFRSPDSPQTNISIQFYRPFWAHNLRTGRMEMYASGKDFVDRRRKAYAPQNVSAGLTDTQVVNHPTGHWLTFTADVHDLRALEDLAGCLDAVYPDDVWQKQYAGANDSLKPDSISAFNRTRHYYAVRQEGAATFLVMLYTAPIDKFDAKLLPSAMATLKMSGGKISVSLQSGACLDSAKYEPEILIDGERKAVVTRPGYCPSAEGFVSAGKHHITVRAKEHKTFEKDIFVEGWEVKYLNAPLERTASSTSGAKPE
jgi:hypothetical protein